MTTAAGPSNRTATNLSHAQRERLAYIEFRLYFTGALGRADLINRFGIAPAAATRDLALYRELAPNNIRFDGSTKLYRFGVAFVPMFHRSSHRALIALSHGFGEGDDAEPAAPLACETPALLCPPPLDTLATVCRAIKARQPLAIRYKSASSEETERVIVPFALVDTGMRWHVRAFDRKRQSFREFVLTRIDVLNAIEEEALLHERPKHDNQWSRTIDLELVPHPRLDRPEIVSREYGMTDGTLHLRVRAAVAGYMLLRWGVDCSPDHHLTGEQYRLWLHNPMTLYGVENARLAPGYQEPACPATSSQAIN